MSETGLLCREVDENMVDIIEGVAEPGLFDHVAACDRCRDARHEAEQLLSELSEAGGDHRFSEAIEARVLAAIDERTRAVPVRDAAEPAATSAALMKPLREPAPMVQATRARALSGAAQRGLWVSVAALVGLALLWLGSTRGGAGGSNTAWEAAGSWRGEVSRLSQAFGSAKGLESCDASGACKSLGVGDAVESGARLTTDGLTRALVKLHDGSVLALDRASSFELDDKSERRGRLLFGSLIAEVEKQAGEPRLSRAIIDVPLGRAEVLGTKFALSASPDAARVEVSRGEVRLVDREDRAVNVLAGEAGQLYTAREPRVETVLDLARAFSWESRAFEPAQEGEAQGALGELTAKKPSQKDEMRGAVRLVEHHVKVRIVDNIARTEVEEVFTNQTGDVLEGIYRFPLPPGAQIERLALDVNGKLEEGAFVDRERAAAIWRGAIVNSGGKKPAPREEIVWVPGPWKDPALLEWQRGNRFELRIFPIPRHGSRRIVLAYTQVLPPSGGGRQYVYPLPRDPAGTTRVDRFTLEAQVRGHDRQRGVVAGGYPLAAIDGAPEVTRLSFEARDFSPSGDLTLSYRLASADAMLRAWAYRPVEREAKARGGSSSSTGSAGSFAGVPADAAYVAIALRPELPRRARPEPRDYVFVADSSRSMLGENYRQASALIARAIAEMDRNDRVAVLACDSICQSLPGGYLAAGRDAAERAMRFLAGIEPEGASDLSFAVEQAARLGAGAGRALRVVYVGDGTPTVGPIHPALIRRAITETLPKEASLSAVAVGSDADRASLEVATQAGGGVTLALSPGRDVYELVYALLGATYGRTLTEARLSLPEGLVAVAPAELGSIAAGSEQLIVARLTRPSVEGRAVLSGLVGGEPFEQSYPLELTATTAQGNAFVPRLYAAVAIAELERSMDEGARRLSIELSTRFNVASRHTSLLVLESPAMFKAFGLNNERGAPEWSGEYDSHKAETWSEDAVSEGSGDASDVFDAAATRAPAATGSGSGAGWSEGRGDAEYSMDEMGASAPRARRAAPKPATSRAYARPPTSAPSPAKDEAEEEGSFGILEKKKSVQSSEIVLAPEVEQSRPHALPPRRMIPMRRVYDRSGRIDVPPRQLEAASAATRDALTARWRAQELSRKALKDLYVSYFVAGELEQAEEMARIWIERDPLDPDALTARADLAAQQGLRDEAIRKLGSVVDVRPGDYKAQWRLARLHRWAGAPARGCRHALAVAQLMLRDAKLVNEALSCARDVGQSAWVSDLLSALEPEVRRQVEAAKPPARGKEELSGDFRVLADWDGAEHDLDLVIIHPDGYRVSWLGAPTQAVISARDVTSVRLEGLALRGAAPGEYAIEVVRSSGGSGTVRGTLQLEVAGEKRKVPFVLDADRVRVATARIRTTSRLVPL